MHMSVQENSQILNLAPTKLAWREKMSFLRMGMSQVEVTPSIGIQSGGWGASKHSRSETIHMGLFVTALAKINANGNVNYIVGADLILMGCIECADSMLTKITTSLGISKDDLLFSSSHSHSTPWICVHRATKEGHELIPDFVIQMISGVIEACQKAKNSAEDVQVTWVYGKCDLATNRDLPCNSKMVVAFNPDIPADDTLAVGRLVNRKGDLVGVIANYACHATTLAWENKSISPDFVGQARWRVQQEIKAPLLFLQGASGDLAPRNQYSADLTLADRNGDVIGFSILATLANMQSSSSELRWEGVVDSGAMLGIWSESKTIGSSDSKEQKIEIEVKVKSLKSLEDLEIEWKGIDPNALDERLRRASRLRLGYKSGQMTLHPAWIWHWGDAIFVAQPGEAYSYLQTELRRRHPEKVIFVMNLTNFPGMYYLPTESAYEKLTYAAEVTIIAPGALEALLEAIDKSIKGLA